MEDGINWKKYDSLDITDRDMQILIRVAEKARKLAPPIDPHTENFIIGREYADVADSAKLFYLLCSLGHLLRAMSIKRKVSSPKGRFAPMDSERYRR